MKQGVEGSQSTRTPRVQNVNKPDFQQEKRQKKSSEWNQQDELKC